MEPVDGEVQFPEAGRPGWHRFAACVRAPNPDAFHDDPSQFDAVRERYCNAGEEGCPVKRECLLDALEHGDREGIWGGTLPRERLRLIRTARSLAEQEAS
jgi:WhiB family redox-sensing transcriptional regulator